MRRWLVGLALAGVCAVGAATPTTTESPSAKSPPKRPLTVRGEILDLSCYLARGLSGPLHRDCARRCLASGVPMGLLTADSTLYLLTLDHGRAMTPASYSTPDPFALCRDWASLQVEVTGMASRRHNVPVIEVSRARLAPPPAGTAP